MGEQAGPRDLVRHAQAAERAGFGWAVASDHHFPWLDSQGHAPYTWSVLGAVSQATDILGLMTYVTCPTFRYHPAVVAQKAATVALLSQNRFTLGLGAGENLNEHVVAGAWPPVNVRHDMLAEAVDIITELFTGEYVTYHGSHFDVDSARIWDLPDRRLPLGVAVSGRQSVETFAALADVMIATEPGPRLVPAWDAARSGASSRKVGQLPISWNADADTARTRAHEQFRWFAGGWKVNSELPGPPSSPRPAGSPGRRTWPDRSPAATAWRPSSRRRARSSTPGSPTPGSLTWRSCRSAATPRTRSSRRPGGSCCRRSPRPPRALTAWSKDLGPLPEASGWVAVDRKAQPRGSTMSIRSMPWGPGTPNWADLTTSDVPAAHAFYAAVLGWQINDLGADFGHYALCTHDGHVTAGIGPAMTPDQPTAWTTYLSVEDVDKTTDLITANGGTVLMPAVTIADQGRMAVAVDPTGAAFGLWQAGRMIGAELVNEPGGMSWNIHRSADPQGARRFYRAVFGFSYTVLNGRFDYATIDGDGPGGALGGIGGSDPDLPAGTPSHWMVHFSVADTDEALSAATSAGALVLAGPLDTPFGRMVTLADPQGALLTLTGPVTEAG